MSEKPDWKKKGAEYARDAVSGSPELDRVALRLAYLAGVRAGLEAAAVTLESTDWRGTPSSVCRGLLPEQS